MNCRQKRIIREMREKLEQFMRDGILEISPIGILDSIKEIEEIERTHISHIWSVEDVQSAADDLGYTLTEDQSIEVLALVESDIDCTVGINWDVINAAVEWYVKN